MPAVWTEVRMLGTRPGRVRQLFSGALCAVVLATGCTAPPSPGGSSPAQTVETAAGTPSPKTLRLAVHSSAEPVEGVMLFGPSGAVGTETLLTFHNSLTVY